MEGEHAKRTPPAVRTHEIDVAAGQAVSGIRFQANGEAGVVLRRDLELDQAGMRIAHRKVPERDVLAVRHGKWKDAVLENILPSPSVKHEVLSVEDRERDALHSTNVVAWLQKQRRRLRQPDVFRRRGGQQPARNHREKKRTPHRPLPPTPGIFRLVASATTLPWLPTAQ